VGHNLDLLRSVIPHKTKLCAAVKSGAYGHGLTILLDTFTRHADWLAVATAGEAMELRRLGYAGPALVFFSATACGPLLDDLVAAGVTLTVVSQAESSAVAQAGVRSGRTVDVHVMIDTGMGRSGVPASKAAALVGHIRDQKSLHLGGLYTHFACSDVADKTSARLQWRRFGETVSECGGRDELMLHAANSAATIDLPETHADMVRPGISVYGYQPSDETHNHLPLRPALRLAGRLMQAKNIPAGGSCGYGLTYTFAKPGRIGLAPIGYGDGYLRCLSNRSTMRIRGRDVPVRGRVSMDQTIIDLTEAPDAKVGDEVEIISSNPTDPHSVEGLARLAGTIPHEVTCRLGARIHRVAAPELPPPPTQ